MVPGRIGTQHHPPEVGGLTRRWPDRRNSANSIGRPLRALALTPLPRSSSRSSRSSRQTERASPHGPRSPAASARCRRTRRHSVPGRVRLRWYSTTSRSTCMSTTGSWRPARTTASRFATSRSNTACRCTSPGTSTSDGRRRPTSMPPRARDTSSDHALRRSASTPSKCGERTTARSAVSSLVICIRPDGLPRRRSGRGDCACTGSLRRSSADSPTQQSAPVASPCR